MSYLATDLSMASLNEAKVANLDEVVKEAKTAIDSHLIDSEQYDAIQSALNRINEKEDYEITPDFVAEVDGVINEASDIIVNRNGGTTLSVSGTENFGLTLTPKEWRKSRVAGCESILEELGKSIKRWSNQLSEKLSEIFTGNRYTIESLEARLVEMDKKLTFIESIKEPGKLITIPSGINKTFRKDNGYLTTQTNFAKILGSEVNFAGICIKSWAEESVRYKNNIIRYFGNKGRESLSILDRSRPKLFSKKFYMDDLNTKLFYWTTPQRLLGDANIAFAQLDKAQYETLKEMIQSTSQVGYDFVSVAEVHTHDKVPDLNIAPFSIDSLEAIKGQVKTIVSIMRLINQKDNDFDADSRDIKDVLSTLKDSEHDALLEGFSEIVSRYQENTIYIQSSFIRYLGQLASHLITFMFINMEAYDDA